MSVNDINLSPQCLLYVADPRMLKDCRLCSGILPCAEEYWVKQGSLN